MKTSLLLSVAAATVGAAQVSNKLTDVKAQSDFMAFVKKFEKNYAVDEIFEKFATFRKNVEMIRSHDAEKHGYTMAINEFADLSSEEFSAMYKGYNHRHRPYARSKNLHVPEPNLSLPSAVDWVEKGAVTPVKNQGQCGSCWSFSTTGSVEGAVQIATGKLISLSEQELVDCAGSAGNQGCNGGLMDDAFEWIIKTGGLTTEENYPYKAEEGSCKKHVKPVSTITGYKDVEEGNEDDLMSAVAKGPVSIAIEADKSGFQFYSGGVFSGECGKQLDHGVLLVGYGEDEDSGAKFWKIKNSWGDSWGEDGYIRISRGNDECGLADSASYAIADEGAIAAVL